MISHDMAAGLVLIAFAVGVLVPWLYFRHDIAELEAQLEDSEVARAELADDLDKATRRAVDAERHIEMLVDEGERDPLSAPIQVIGGAA